MYIPFIFDTFIGVRLAPAKKKMFPVAVRRRTREEGLSLKSEIGEMEHFCTIISPNTILREGLRRLIADEGFAQVRAFTQVHEIDWPTGFDDHLELIDIPSREERDAALDALRAVESKFRSLILADQFSYEDMIGCFRSGACGSLTKDTPSVPLIAALKLASMGGRVVPFSLVEMLLHQRPAFADVPCIASECDPVNLSHRENEVLTFLMAGHANKVIARRLDLSEATVKVHVKAILRKLKVGNRTQAALWGAAHGATLRASPHHISAVSTRTESTAIGAVM